MSRSSTEGFKEDFIASMLAANKTYKEIEMTLHCSPKRISRLKKSIISTSNTPDPLKKGAPMKANDAVKDCIKQITTEDPRMFPKYGIRLPALFVHSLYYHDQNI